MLKRPIVLAAFSLALMTIGQPAFAENGSLAAGTQFLSQGNYASAVKQLSAALADSKLGKADAAKALYQRGVAQRMLGKQSGAIADLSQAIWLGDLSSGEKMRAHVHRGMAYQASGLGAQAQADIAEARKIDAGGAERMLTANQGGAAPAAAPVRAPQPPAQPARPAAPQAAEAPVQSQPKRAEAPRQPEAPRKVEAPKQIQPRAGQLPPGENVPAAWQTEDAIAADREQKEGGRVSRFFGGITDRVRGWTGREKQEEPVQQPLSNDEWAATVTPAEKPKRIAQKQEQAQQPAAQAQQPAVQPQQAQAQAQPAQAPQPVGQPQQLQPQRQQIARAAAPDVPQPVQPQAPRAPQPLQQAAAGGGGGDYLLQLASARSEQDAQTAWQTISSRNAQLVGGRPPIVKQANLGSLGTFYRVHIGPFQDKTQSVNLCNEFKRQGVDCFLVTR